VTELMERAKQAEKDAVEYEKSKAEITTLKTNLNICE